MHKVCRKGDEEEIIDEFGIMTLKVAELKTELKSRNLLCTSLKTVLQQRLLIFLQNEKEEGDNTLREEVENDQEINTN